MGRPLKIAKGQVVTITAMNGTTEVVTTNANFGNLGIIAGMPFTVTSSSGNLVAGTQYWILQVINSGSNSTFTVSATDLSSNVNNTPFNLATVGPVTVIMTVGYAIDSGFSNPDGSNTATNSTSYGAVGGNTALYGKQALANIAIGAAGTGTVFADTGSDIVTGYGTDFANLTTGTTLYALWGDGTGTPMRLGVTTSTAGDLTVAVANTQNTGNIIGTSGNAQTLVEGSPVTFTANLGGLVTGTTYWVLNVANAAAFTVSLTPGGAEVDLSSATGTPDAVQQQVVLTANSANNATGVNGTGDGFVTALHEAGYILRQKGKTKYLVQGATSGLIGAVYTANVANASLQPNTMNILATYADSSTKYVSSLNDYQTEVFPTQVASGSLVAGTVYTIYSTGTSNWTSVGAASNMTGVTFKATGTTSGTGTAVVSTVNPDVIATFGTAYAANTYPGTNPITGQTSAVSGQPNPIVTISNA